MYGDFSHDSVYGFFPCRHQWGMAEDDDIVKLGKKEDRVEEDDEQDYIEKYHTGRPAVFFNAVRNFSLSSFNSTSVGITAVRIALSSCQIGLPGMGSSA